MSLKLIKNRMKVNYIKLIKFIHVMLLMVSLLVSFINVFTYNNFFAKHFYVSPLLIYLTYTISSFIEKVYVIKHNDRLFKILNKISFFGGSIVGITYIILMIIEVFTYTNFIFSKLHINYNLLIYPATIFFIEYVFGLNIKNVSRNFVSGLRKLVKLDTIVIPLVLLILVNNVTGIALRLKKDIYFMITNIFASSDQIYEFKLGKKFYDFTQFIRSNTPDESRILIPPFPAYPWPQTGNAVYLRYFLNPRYLYSGNEYIAEVDIKSYDYILIAWGETPTTSGNYTHGWPKFDVKAEYILLLNDDGSTNKILGDYKYASIKGIEKWGIIKVKR